MGKTFSPSNPLWSLTTLPQRGPLQSPDRKRISVLSRPHRMHLVEMYVVIYCPVSRHCWFRKWAAADRRVQKARLGRGLGWEGMTPKVSPSEVPSEDALTDYGFWGASRAPPVDRVPAEPRKTTDSLLYKVHRMLLVETSVVN